MHRYVKDDEVATHHIIAAIANRLRLPLEYGYKLYMKTVSHLAFEITVSCRHVWGDGKIVFMLWCDPDMGSWYPENRAYAEFLSDNSNLPEPVRKRSFTLEIRRKEVSYRRKWEKGAYPRYHVRILKTERLKESKYSTTDA